MPFTPFHLGIGLCLGLLCFRWLDFPTFLVANMIVDARAVLVFFDFVSGPIHGFLHTFIFATLLAVGLATLSLVSKPTLNRVLRPLFLAQQRSLTRITLAALIGVYAHVVLDSILYTDIRPFYPLSGNPFLGLYSSVEVYFLCVVGFVFGIGLYLTKVVTERKNLDVPLWTR